MYYLHDRKEQAGPFSFEDLEKIENKDHYYVWFEGLNDWQLLSSLFEKPQRTIIKEITKEGIAESNSEVIIDSSSNENVFKILLVVVGILALIITGFYLYNYEYDYKSTINNQTIPFTPADNTSYPAYPSIDTLSVSNVDTSQMK